MAMLVYGRVAETRHCLYVEDSFTLMRKFKEFQATQRRDNEGTSLGVPICFCTFFEP